MPVHSVLSLYSVSTQSLLSSTQPLLSLYSASTQSLPSLYPASTRPLLSLWNFIPVLGLAPASSLSPVTRCLMLGNVAGTKVHALLDSVPSSIESAFESTWMCQRRTLRDLYTFVPYIT